MTSEFRSDDSVGNLYTDGVVTNIATFRKNITDGSCANPTVEPSVRSNLTTILVAWPPTRGPWSRGTK